MEYVLICGTGNAWSIHSAALNMIRFLTFGLVCLVFTSVAAGNEEADVVSRLDAWDAAIAARDLAELTELAASSYVYVEPDRQFVRSDGDTADRASLQNRLLARVTRDIGWADADPRVLIMDDTAVATGTYQLIKPDLLAGGKPRLVAQGRYTTTWVKRGGAWRLLAEHRSLNDVQAWSGGIAASPRKPDWAKDPSESAVTARLTAAAGTPASKTETGMNARDIYHENQSRREHRGLLPDSVTHIFRAYEPTQVGLTWDQDDDPYVDFSFSPMVALHPRAANYPDDMRRRTDEGLFRPLRLSTPNLYFAATLRAGQYLKTRPSSPVVGKRFNPLLMLRLWGEDVRGGRESMGNFLEFVYAHESNGQFISSEQRFDDQVRVYRDQAQDAQNEHDFAIATNSARRSARDNISRGWDYLGMQFARDWDARLPWSSLPVIMGLNAKFSYYLDDGVLQGPKEEYNTWENDVEGKPRSQTDGVSLRYTLLVDPWHERREPTAWQRFIRLERRYAFTWTTGYEKPFKYNTLKAEGTIMLMDVVPLTFWMRYGYNSDFSDYYRKDRSIGLALSYWDF